ncbi:MAG: hypothetical protein A2826_00305 [Candidatus Doudnabacteria bacterium RIFCSPHIGHO2_01_FULL_43_23]|uniref:Hydrolase TatD n=1 Tax=Candidatus Doudnabacteria bacterium RIFCSPHIGHO2_01_FULL_43_23 TaxID=1817822 RepID=A0A1F5NTQ3_9BACT|nr:MAG: hypothetical protein A2826_00305 [Candidatus Doudnabacteria bacterium RIFCSPHIGHO2_01_FULL_43_23]
MFIDTHAHVNFNRFKEDSKEVLEDSLKNNTWVINVGSEYRTSKRAVEMAGKFDQGVYAVIGLHPIHTFAHEVDEEEDSFISREEIFDYDKYKELALDEKTVGIGECGLEYFRLIEGKEDEIKKKQEEIFRAQIDLAADVGKTLMIHSRDAYEAVYEILKESRNKLANVVIHSFISSYEEAKKFLDLDCYISFNGIITYKPSKEKKPGLSDPGLFEAVEKVPLERTLLETDCPYLAPQKVRGTRNIPKNVEYVAEKIAEVKGLEKGSVEEQTTKNARLVFGI